MAWGCGSKEGCVSFLSLFFFSFACSLHLRSCSLSPLVVFAAMRFCRKKIEQEEGMVVDRLLLLLERGGDVVGVVVADRDRKSVV